MSFIKKGYKEIQESYKNKNPLASQIMNALYNGAKQDVIDQMVGEFFATNKEPNYIAVDNGFDDDNDATDGGFTQAKPKNSYHEPKSAAEAVGMKSSYMQGTVYHDDDVDRILGDDDDEAHRAHIRKVMAIAEGKKPIDNDEDEDGNFNVPDPEKEIPTTTNTNKASTPNESPAATLRANTPTEAENVEEDTPKKEKLSKFDGLYKKDLDNVGSDAAKLKILKRKIDLYSSHLDDLIKRIKEKDVVDETAGKPDVNEEDITKGFNDSITNNDDFANDLLYGYADGETYLDEMLKTTPKHVVVSALENLKKGLVEAYGNKKVEILKDL